jgi:hypothetical protein
MKYNKLKFEYLFFFFSEHKTESDKGGKRSGNGRFAERELKYSSSEWKTNMEIAKIMNQHCEKFPKAKSGVTFYGRHEPLFMKTHKVELADDCKDLDDRFYGLIVQTQKISL